MRQLLRYLRSARWLLCLAAMLLLFISSADSASAQTWRGVYCIAWDQTITPTRVVWSTSVRGGQTYQLVLPPPSTPETVQRLAVSWGVDMNMPDTVCTWRVIDVQQVITVPAGALYEIQLIELDTVPIGPSVTRDNDMREIVIPASVHNSLNWALQDGVVQWLIAIPLGAYLAREWIWAIRRMVRGWYETAQSGDEEWERYNAERGIYYDEDEGEFKRLDHRA